MEKEEIKQREKVTWKGARNESGRRDLERRNLSTNVFDVALNISGIDKHVAAAKRVERSNCIKYINLSYNLNQKKWTICA